MHVHKQISYQTPNIFKTNEQHQIIWHNYCFRLEKPILERLKKMSEIKSLARVYQRGDREISIDEVKLDDIISHFSGLIERDNLLHTELRDRTEVEKALNLALVAMAEAEKRIDRQEKRIKQLEKLSITDELTKLLNRRGFLAQLKRTLSSSKRSGVGGSLVMLDLDRFKNINDRYGHIAGDKLLQKVANSLKLRVRDSDTIGRLGGDEFAIILAGLPSSMVSNRIEEIQDAIKHLHFEWENQTISICASIGRYDYSGTETYIELINLADLSMYDKKLQKNTNKKFFQ